MKVSLIVEFKGYNKFMSIFKANFVTVQFNDFITPRTDITNIFFSKKMYSKRIPILKRKSKKFSTKVREIISSHPESKYHEQKPITEE